MMPGVDFGEFQQALLDAFDEKELETLVRFRLNKRLGAIVGPGPTNYIIFQLLEWAEREGAPVVIDLARAAYLERPRNTKSGASMKNSGWRRLCRVRKQVRPLLGLLGAPRQVGLEATVSPRLRPSTWACGGTGWRGSKVKCAALSSTEMRREPASWSGQISS